MSLYRRAAKRDQSEKKIVEMLEACGWRVLKVSVKDGPDLIVAKRVGVWCNACSFIAPRTVAIEVKTGKAKLKKGQSKWHDEWPGEKAIIRDVEGVRDL